MEDRRGIITNYTVSYLQTQNTSLSVVMIVEMDQLFLMLSGLEKFTNYRVSVRANTVVGSGPNVTGTVMTLSDRE